MSGEKQVPNPDSVTESVPTKSETGPILRPGPPITNPTTDKVMNPGDTSKPAVEQDPKSK